MILEIFLLQKFFLATKNDSQYIDITEIHAVEVMSMLVLPPLRAAALICGISLLPLSAAAAEAAYSIVIKDHKFIPETLKVKAGEKIRLTIRNEDSTAEEFESHDLQREKIVPPNSEVVVLLRPLSPGVYGFFGEFNPATAQGKIVAE